MDAYQKWKQEQRAIYLKAAGGNEHLADNLLAHDILDTDSHKPLGFTKAALAAYDGSIPKNRSDVAKVKTFCRQVRGHLSGLAMSDLVRYRVESVFDAVEELSDVQE
jgi:hypothetical protein